MRHRLAVLSPLAVLIVAGGLWTTTRLPAAEARKKSAAPPAKFAQVEEWRGFTELSETRMFDRTFGGSRHVSRQEELLAHGTFALRRDPEWKWDPARGSFRWKGSTQVQGRHAIAFADHTLAGSFAGAFERWQQDMGGTHEWRDSHFEIFLPDRHFSVHAGSPGELPVRRVGAKRYNNGTWNDEAIDEKHRNFLRPFRLETEDRGRHGAQLANGPGVITFTTEKAVPDRARTLYGDLIIRSRVTLYPVYDDLEVEVTLPGYAEWRPQGNIEAPKKPGNALAARAVLKSKTGRTKQLPEVELFRFELLDTSREPGVCLNWPLNAKDSDYDLRLANFSAEVSGEQMKAAQKFFAAWGLASAGDYDLASMPPGGLPPMSFGEVSEDGQKAELRAPPKDKAGQPYAEAAIESYDFGAKSELRVVCVLKDGREIIGLMKAANGEQDLVRLPRRAGPDWVAEKWREDNDATKLAANDDDEKVEGQRHHGDGFTLYEEYRGWVVNGRHVTGDPKRKDFFVLNQRGADFRGGLALFQRLARLRVHATLRDGAEISEEQRCMNANRRDAPHRVAQHGVILASGNGPRGGLTVGVDKAKDSRAFRPRLVAKIFMEPSTAGRGDIAFSIGKGVGDYKLSQRDAELAWDRGVAHELFHSVGVDHHGDLPREKVCCYFQSGGIPTNPTGRPRYATYWDDGPSNFMREDGQPAREQLNEERGPTIVLRWEDTQRDVFEDDLAEYERKVAELRAYHETDEGKAALAPHLARLAHTGKGAAWWTRYINATWGAGAMDMNRVIWVGKKNGTDSGHDLCVMKYYFADAYRIEGQADAYYLIRPGAVKAGREICRSPAGTGGNAPTHAPQPRFGNAAGGRGNCFADICPNDAIPPRAL